MPRPDNARTEAEYKAFLKEIEASCGGFRRLSYAFFSAVRMMALAIERPCVIGEASISRIEDEWKRLRSGYTDEQYSHVVASFALLTEALERKREEFLGHIMESCLAATNQGNGQFLTPVSVSGMMARTLSAPPPDDEYIISVNDCCCGAGVLLIEAAEALHAAGWQQRNIYIDAGDVDGHALDMCYVQLSLLGYSAVTHHQNALTREVMSPTRYTIGYFLHGTEWRLAAQRRREANKERISDSSVEGTTVGKGDTETANGHAPSGPEGAPISSADGKPVQLELELN